MRMKWLAVLAFGYAWPAVGQGPPEAADLAAMSDAQLIEQADAGNFSEPCRIEVPLYGELVTRNPEHAGRKVLHLNAQALCADEEGRYEEGLGLVEQAELTLPQRQLFPFLGLYFANRLEDGAEALSRLRILAERGQLRTVPDNIVYEALRTIRKAQLGSELDAFSYGLTSTSGFETLKPELQGAFAAAALRHGAKIGDASRIDRLLAYDPNPAAFVDFLAEREYEPFWPQIEAFAGDNLRKASDAYVQHTAQQFAETPEDRDRLSRYAHALHFAGRFQEAVELARDARAGRLEVEEGDAWSLNIEAYALDALGRRDEADAVFDELAALPADEHPWVVNFVINRASRLVGQERWAEGLEATVLARSVAEEHGSTYAKLIIARDRACALQHLGRTDEIAREVDFLVANFNENAPLATTGLVCVGKRGEAEELLARALDIEAARLTVLYEMQDPRFELFYTPSSLPLAREIVLANPALRDEVLRHVRILPDRFVPIAYLRRQPPN